MQKNSPTFFFLPIFATVFIDFMGMAIVIPIFAPLLLDPSSGILPEAIGLNERGIILGFLIAAYPIGQFFGSPLLGKLSDRQGRKQWLVWTLAGTAMGYVIAAIAILNGSIVWLFVGRAITGLMGGNSSVAQSAVADLANEKTRAVYFGYLGLAMGLGFVLGPVIGGRLADADLISWFSWDTPFWFSAILAGINSLLVGLFFKETLKKRQTVKISFLDGITSLGKAFTLGPLTALFGVFFFFVIGWFFFAQFFQVYLIQKFHYDQTQIGDTYTYIGLVYAFFQGALAPPISKHFHSRRIVLVSLFCLIFALMALLIPQRAWILYFIYPPIALFVCLCWPNILSLVSRMATGENQGEILGINQSLQSLAQAITPIASGPLVASHRMLPTFFAAGSVAIAWLILWLGVKPSTVSKKEHLSPPTPNSLPLQDPPAQDSPDQPQQQE